LTASEAASNSRISLPARRLPRWFDNCINGSHENTHSPFLERGTAGRRADDPVVMTTRPLLADDRTYHDKGHNDDHAWNAHEDKAYRIWAKENHRKYVDFAKLRAEDQESYWAWRHEHSDAVLKIDIH